MAAITQYTHFVNDLNLPNAGASGSSSEATAIASAITQHEEDYLKCILGYSLWELFNDGIGYGSIYDDLKNGTTFVDTYGVTRKWEGFSTAGKNPAACYIYYQIQAAKASNTLGIGESVADIENGKRVSPSSKMAAAWNKMAGYNKTLHDFLYANRTTYPDYIGLTYPPCDYVPADYPDYLRMQQSMFIKILMF